MTTGKSQTEPATVGRLIAEARVAQSELAWLGGFLSTRLPEDERLADRCDNAYRVLQLLIDEVDPDVR